jgi:hypothetical protein
MSASIHARLDEETNALRNQLKRSQGCTDSEIVRRGIRLLAATTLKSRQRRRFTGVGKYHSGIPDLSTNPKYMEGFGE